MAIAGVLQNIAIVRAAVTIRCRASRLASFVGWSFLILQTPTLVQFDFHLGHLKVSFSSILEQIA